MPGHWPHEMGYGAHPGWIMGFGGLTWLIFLALAIVAIVFLTRSQGQPAPGDPGAVNILAERYARGEIQREEYLQKRRDILKGD